MTGWQTGIPTKDGLYVIQIHPYGSIKTITKHKENENPWHTGTPTEEGWYLLECNIGKSDGTYYATDYWNNEVGYWTVNRVIRWRKIKED